MRVLLGLEGFDPCDRTDEDWEIDVSMTEGIAIPGESDLTLVETTERDPARLLEYLRHQCPYHHGWSGCCAVFAAEDGREARRRAVNLYGPPPDALRPGDLWMAGWFLGPEHQRLGIAFEIAGRACVALALDATDGMTLWIAAQGAGREPEPEAATKREENWQRMRMHEEQELLPDECVVNGIVYGLGGGRYYAEMRAGRFLAEFWRKAVPEGWDGFELMEASWDYLNERRRTRVPRLPICSLSLRWRDRHSKELPLRQAFTARVGEQDERIDFTGPEDGEPMYFWLEGLYLEDVNRRARENPHADKGTLLPDGWQVLTLLYECPFSRYYQLDFHFREELEQKPGEKWPPEGHPYLRRFHPETRDENGLVVGRGSVGWIFMSKENGPHGFRRCVCSLGPVTGDFCGEAEMELTGAYETREAPPEIVLLKAEVEDA